MKKFIINILIFFAGFFLVDKLLIVVRNTAPDREPDKRMEELYTGRANYDIVILGSSRGARDIIAAKIQDSLKLKTKNFSFPGSGVVFHDYILSLIIKNSSQKPKLVILNLDDPEELNTKASRLMFRYDLIYPQVKYGQALDKLIADGQKNEWLARLFVAHQMSMSNLDLSNHKPKPINVVEADGSMPIDYADPAFDGSTVNDQGVYDVRQETKEGVESFMDIVNTCRTHHIQLLMVLPPNYYQRTIGFIDRFRTLTDNKVDFFIHDAVKYPFSKEKKYYFDDVHLQRSGAMLFTDELINYLRISNVLLQKD